MGTDEKLPQWMRVRTNDYDTPAGRYMLAGGTTADWAGYGRWFALRQMLATTPGAMIAVGSDRQLGCLSRTLGMPGRARCREWLSELAECGAISAADLAEGWVADPDVCAQADAYARKVEGARRARESRAEG